MDKKIVAIFGGREVASTTYAQARELGYAVARAGYIVMTGGYGGVMEAASRGAQEAGGHVIGVTVARFEENGRRPNAWVHEDIKFPALFQRLHYLVTTSHAIMVLSGSIGTLSEVALAWSLLQTNEMPPKPLVLVGASWQRVLETFAAEFTVNPRDWDLLTFAPTIAQAIKFLP